MQSNKIKDKKIKITQIKMILFLYRKYSGLTVGVAEKNEDFFSICKIFNIEF